MLKYSIFGKNEQKCDDNVTFLFMFAGGDSNKGGGCVQASVHTCTWKWDVSAGCAGSVGLRHHGVSKDRGGG